MSSRPESVQSFRTAWEFQPEDARLDPQQSTKSGRKVNQKSSRRTILSTAESGRSRESGRKGRGRYPVRPQQEAHGTGPNTKDDFTNSLGKAGVESSPTDPDERSVIDSLIDSLGKPESLRTTPRRLSGAGSSGSIDYAFPMKTTGAKNSQLSIGFASSINSSTSSKSIKSQESTFSLRSGSTTIESDVHPKTPSLDGKYDVPRSPPQESAYPPPAKLAVILVSLYISIFLVALDRTIIGPAIPEITNKFNSISDIGWYGSAYMLTSCGFILFYGRIYTFFATKWVFLASIALFEIGSAICGAAPSSKALIVGRSVAGIGSSGIYTGAILIITEIVPLHKRPLINGLFGVCFGVASVAGPLLGGAFTGSKATWRWCFFINLPLGGFTIMIVSLFLHIEDEKDRPGWKRTVRNLDPIGTLLFLPSIVCLLLALEWGATEYPWSDGRIIALLVVFAILLVAFIAWQYFTRKTTATITSNVAFQRSVACGGLSQFCVGATMITCSLYIPLWFQAIKGVDAMQSGIQTIPLVLSVVVGSIFSGAAVQKIGYYSPFMVAGGILLSTGAGLLTTWSLSSGSDKWIGYQILLGLGVGLTMQHPNLAVQVVLPKRDIATGTAFLSLCQTLGGALFASVGQNIFLDKFRRSLQSIEGVDPEMAVHAGATALQDTIPEKLLPQVLKAYNRSLTQGPFLAVVIVACFSVPAALGMEWRSVKERQKSDFNSVSKETIELEMLGNDAGIPPSTPRSTASSYQKDDDTAAPSPSISRTSLGRNTG